MEPEKRRQRQMTLPETDRLAYAAQKGGVEGQRALADLLSYLSPWLENKIRGRRISDPDWSDDLFGICVEEVVLSTQNYDPQVGPYLPYCRRCLGNGPLRYVTRDAWERHESNSELSTVLNKVRRHLAQYPDDETLSDDELAEKVGVEKETLAKARDFERTITTDSLDAPLGEEGEEGLIVSEVLVAEGPPPERVLIEAIEEERRAEGLQQLEKALPQYLRRVFQLRLRKWFAGETPLTVDEALRKLNKRTNCTDFRFDLLWREDRIRELLARQASTLSDQSERSTEGAQQSPTEGQPCVL